MGGTNEEMQRVNEDYERATKRIERMGERFVDDCATNSENAESTNKTTVADMEAYAEILQKLFAMDGIEVELCGSWLWITGNTFAFRSELKEAGCKWSKSKQAWYWYSGEYHRRSKRGYSLEEIRDLHGSETIRGRAPGKLSYT